MCGIIARVGSDDGIDQLLDGLENLEYRGYDSAGVAIKPTADARPSVVKCAGRIDRLHERISGALDGAIGIGHTRWSTHGPPSDANAHPHTDCDGDVTVVHNGIIENHERIRDDLRERGHTFESDTDTEVVPHLVEDYRSRGLSTEAAFRKAIDRLDGSYAVAMLTDDSDAVYATRRGSPLVLGIGDDCYYLASDIPAFLEYTDDVVYVDDGQTVVVTPEGYRIVDEAGDEVSLPVRTVEWDATEVGKGTYDHYMRKEIDEQPRSLRQSIHGRADDESGDRVELDDFPLGEFADVTNVHLVGCGTSYHAARYAVELCSRRNLPAQAFLASEYASSSPPAPDGTLVVGVTQSGETADTLEALRTARTSGTRTLALTNVVGSTAARECDDAVFIHAGPEIGVAATKTFSSQIATLGLLLERVADDVPAGEPVGEAFLSGIRALPDAVQSVLDTSSIAEVANLYADAESYFFIGRGTGYAVAMEAALKFKEITYEHAEGFAAGELKHGPLALVTENTPVFGVFTGESDEKLRHNLQEVRARGAPVVAVTDSPAAVERVADHVVTVPDIHPDVCGVPANVQFQLLSYYAAERLNRPIDKPRNLAKSVTVE